MTPRISQRLLIVDDDPVALCALGELLEGEGVEVDTTPSPQQAFVLAASRRPDLMLVDMYMPVMSGLELLRALRSAALDVPVVMMTASESVAARLEARLLGVELILEEPLELSRVVSSIRTALGSKGTSSVCEVCV